MENRNMFQVWSFDYMTEELEFHGIAPRNWLAREAIEKMAINYMDYLNEMGFMRPTIEWGRNETEVTITYGLHSRRFYFKPIIIGEIKP